MRGIHRGPVNSPHKGPVTRKMIPFDDVIMRLKTVLEIDICSHCWIQFIKHHHVNFALALTIFGLLCNVERQVWTKLFINTPVLTPDGAEMKRLTFSNVFSSMKMVLFQLKFPLSLFPRVQLPIFQHWFRGLGVYQATSHYMNQLWLDYRRIYASFGLNELKHLEAFCLSR